MNETNGKAIAAMVLGISGLVLVPIVPSVLAIIFGRQALDEIDETPEMAGKGMAQAGLVTGIVGLALWAALILLLVLLVALASAAGDPEILR